MGLGIFDAVGSPFAKRGIIRHKEHPGWRLNPPGHLGFGDMRFSAAAG